MTTIRDTRLAQLFATAAGAAVLLSSCGTASEAEESEQQEAPLPHTSDAGEEPDDDSAGETEEDPLADWGIDLDYFSDSDLDSLREQVTAGEVEITYVSDDGQTVYLASDPAEEIHEGTASWGAVPSSVLAPLGPADNARSLPYWLQVWHEAAWYTSGVVGETIADPGRYGAAPSDHITAEVAAGPAVDDQFQPTGDFVVPVPVFGFHYDDGRDAYGRSTRVAPHIEDLWLASDGERISTGFHSGLVAAGWSPGDTLVTYAVEHQLGPDVQEPDSSPGWATIGFVIDPDVAEQYAGADLQLGIRFADADEPSLYPIAASYEPEAVSYDGTCHQQALEVAKSFGDEGSFGPEETPTLLNTPQYYQQEASPECMRS